MVELGEFGAAVLLLPAQSPATSPSAPASDSGSTTVIIVVAIVTVLGTIATAMGPTLVEVVKGFVTLRGGKSSASTTPTPKEPPVADPLSSVVRSGTDALDMVEAAVLDYRQQRDAALLRVDTLQGRLDEANSVIARQQVIIAQLEARLNAQNPPPSPYGQGNYGQMPPDWRPR